MAEDLVIRINGDVKNFQDALGKVQKQTEDLDSALASVAKISGVAFAALTAEIGLSVKAFAESEQATKRLKAALDAQGLSSTVLTEKYQRQAKAIQELSGMDDDAVVSAQASLQAMIGQTEISEQLTLAIANLSAAKQMDLTTSAELIGKGINGHTAALKKAGLEVGEFATKEERMAAIIEMVNGKFAGQAEAAGSGVTGAMRKLKMSFSDLQEEIGARFAPLVERAANAMSAFFKFISENQALVTFVASAIAAGVALTGLVTAGTALVTAFTAASAWIAAFGAAVGVALGPVTLIAAGLVAAAAAVGVLAAKADETKSPLQQLTEDIVKLEEQLKKLEAAETPFNTALIATKRAELEAELAIAIEKHQKLEAHEFASDQRKKAAKAAMFSEEQATEAKALAAKLEAARVQREMLALQLRGASEEEIALTREKNELLAQLADENYAELKGAIQGRLDEISELQKSYSEGEREKRQAAFELLLAQNEEFQALDMEQRRIFLEQHKAQLIAGMAEEEEIRRAAAARSLQAQNATNTKFLENQKKYGTAYAMISEAMNSEVYRGFKQAAGELVQLQGSSNKTLMRIGKAAAVANIIMKSGESAMNIFAGFSTIPFVGPALGIAGAAAAIAFGAEQIGRVTGAGGGEFLPGLAAGGVISGGVPGRDSVNARLMPGELVAPTANFEEVIGSVAAQRAAEEMGGTAFGGGETRIIFEMKDEFMDFIETKLVERANIGISLQRTT